MQIETSIKDKILDVINEPISFIDKEYKYIYANNAYCRQLNKKKTEIIGNTVKDVFGEEEFNKTLKPNIDHCLKGNICEFRFKGLYKGKPKILDKRYEPIKNKADNINGIISIDKDITYEEKIKNNWVQTINSVDDVLLIIDENYRIYNFNKKAEEIFKLDNELIKRKKCYEIIYQKKEPPPECPLKKSIKTRKTEKSEFYFEKHKKWLKVKTSPFAECTNGVNKFVDVINDITEQVKAQNALKESEEKFQQIAENINQVLYIFDPKKKKFLYANSAFEKIYEMSLKELLKNPREYKKRIHPDDIKNYEKAVRDEKQYRKFINTIYRLLMPDGRIKWIHARNFPVNNLNNDATYRIVGFAEDITDVKNSEIKLKEANEAKEKLFSVISHDIKTPLNHIATLSELVNNQFDEYSREKLRKFIKAIWKSSSSLTELVENLLTWTYAQRERLSVNKTSFNLAEITDNCIENLSISSNNKDIEILKNIPDDFSVFADKEMINTVLRNLISNAIKFTYKGGIIEIAARQEQNKVLIQVLDNGIGIDENNLNNIFTKNKNNINSGTEGEKGTGLGLLISKEFIEKHNGEIWAESLPGSGTAFNFTIPDKNHYDK